MMRWALEIIFLSLADSPKLSDRISSSSYSFTRVLGAGPVSYPRLLKSSRGKHLFLYFLIWLGLVISTIF